MLEGIPHSGEQGETELEVKSAAEKLMESGDDLPQIKWGDVFTRPRKRGHKYCMYKIGRIDASEGKAVCLTYIDGWWHCTKWLNINRIRHLIQEGTWVRAHLREGQLGPLRAGSNIDYKGLARLFGLYETDITEWFRKYLEGHEARGGNAFDEADRLLRKDPWQALILFAEEMRSDSKNPESFVIGL